ncbi:MAG: DUF488 domain-containing protein [Gemmatimonadales bacterium]
MLRLKRVYEPPDRSDGRRILVDRLWPRGLSKKDAAVDEWLKDLAPSTELRRWFDHQPEKWPEFQRRYRHELRAHADSLRVLTAQATRGKVTLVYGARDEAHNDAVELARIIRARIERAAATHKRKHRTTNARTDGA